MKRQYRKDLEQVIYSDNSRKVYRCGNKVFKQDPSRLNYKWRQQMEVILKSWNVPGFVHFINNGYVTEYINGSDLHGNLPFIMNPKILTSILTSEQALLVLPIFAGAIKAGQETGVTLGDLTCGNMMLDQDRIVLIDYDVIVPWPLSLGYIRLWSRTLRIIFS